MFNLSMGNHQYSLVRHLIFIAFLCLTQSCKKPGDAKTAFYYWKSSFNLNKQQNQLIKETSCNMLYTRFFDITWDDQLQGAYPNAIIDFTQPPGELNITPVIFITNKTFENIPNNLVDSMAINSNLLINRIAKKNNITYKTIQIDCDWTLNTREKYFNFLIRLKKVSNRHVEATIRLHQIKYKERTGVPPVDKGVLMFYNMGKLNSGLQQPSSIYNEADAEKYVAWIRHYPLPLDVALPLFSWAVHIREGRIIQLYNNLGKTQLSNPVNFTQLGNVFRAKKSFFLNGVYIKENDIFKLEQMDVKTLKKAAEQLSTNLSQQKNRTIIYYELGSLNLSEFKAETLNEVSAAF
jgi:hypothetical protein